MGSESDPPPATPTPLLALAVVPGLATAAVWVVATVAEDGPLHDSWVFVFGAPAALSAAVVYRLARRERPAWAFGAAVASVAWFFIFYVSVVLIVNPD